MDFKELGLSEQTIKAISDAGIVSPTTVQADVIPSILAGKDVFTIAPTGCGKTCSYVFPLIDIISRHEAKNILIITSGSRQSVVVSDRFAVFNKYHEINKSGLDDDTENENEEANVIIASPNLLTELLAEEKIDLSQVDILVVDDINLIKKMHQLGKLEKILEVLPANKQNIVYTNRRSKETQNILDKILQTPEEIKIDRDKEQEAVNTEIEKYAETKVTSSQVEEIENQPVIVSPKNAQDAEAVNLVKKYHVFGQSTPAFLLTTVELVQDD